MMIDASQMVSMTQASQDFSAVARMVDQEGVAFITKNNQPRYAVVDFEAYESFAAAMHTRRAKIAEAADAILEENMEAFLELAK